MGVKLQSSLGGSVEINAPSTASSYTITAPAVSGTMAANSGTSTDNAIVRFDGTGGAVQNSTCFIDDSGNMGVGTNTPGVFGTGSKLCVVGSITSGGVNYSAQFSDGINNTFRLGHSTGVGHIAIDGGAIAIESGGSERMRLDASGNLLVGTTSASVTVNGFRVIGSRVYSVLSASTDADSTMHVYSSGAGSYRFFVGMSGTVYATNTSISSISDLRFKENIRDIEHGLEAVMSLKPRVFDWKEGKGKDIKNDRGFVAQEFEEVFPDLVDEWKDAAPEGEEPYKSVRQDLIPVLVKAIQEQQAIITELKARIEILEGQA